MPPEGLGRTPVAEPVARTMLVRAAGLTRYSGLLPAAAVTMLVNASSTSA